MGERIDAITSGTDGTTLAGLKAAIEQEVTNRTQAVASVDAKANKAQQDVDALKGVVGTEADNTGLFKKINDEITRATGAENDLADDIEANATAINTEKDRAMEEEGRLAGLITSNATAATNAVNAEKERAMEEEARIEGLIEAEVTRATGAENAISSVANDAQSKANQNALDIAGLQSADTTITNRIAAEETRAKNAESALGGRIDAAVEEAKTHAKQSALNAVIEDVGELSETVTSQGQTISGIQGNITTLDGKITDEIQDRKDEITRVEGLISKEAKDRADAITQEVADRNTAITNAVNTAKTELNQTITKNTTNIQKNATAISNEVTRAKAAEEANANAIADVSGDLTDEIARAKAAEKANADAIAAEKTRAEGKETQLNTAISTLNTNLSKDISDEAATRASEDTRVLNDAKAYADGLLEAADAMRYMGTVGDSVTDKAAKRF